MLKYTAAWLADLVERRSAEREGARSNPGRTNTQGHDICKWSDFLVFSDKDEKPYVLSHRTFLDLFLWDVKEPDPGGGVANLYGLWDWEGMAPLLGPESRSCTFPLDWPVSRKAGN